MTEDSIGIFFILIPMAIWFLCYPLTFILAYSRGTSGIGWLILSLFITPIISIALILIMYPKGGSNV